MSCRFSALFVLFLWFGITVQNTSPAHIQSMSSVSGFDLPEVDGSAVEDTCRFFFLPTPTAAAPDTTTTTTVTPPTTTTTVTPPTTTTTVVAAPPKVVVQSPQRRPAPNNSGAAKILQYFLSSRVGGAVRAPTGGRSQSSSQSHEIGAVTALRRGGRMDRTRWRGASISSEDSSDE
ncbi:cell wall protein DAN4-like isoform X2 [Sphaeramia orbicularis]|uniref:cell wall protein DAN4-like isoform X2 n=1 Tax=Sphaeramia orbicularis TaxID=375764 RepID=UPI00117CE7C5|nr:cell wall protein DAN4-like isoform X2 [Sphaeramia orbicularis]